MKNVLLCWFGEQNSPKKPHTGESLGGEERSPQVTLAKSFLLFNFHYSNNSFITMHVRIRITSITLHYNTLNSIRLT